MHPCLLGAVLEWIQYKELKDYEIYYDPLGAWRGRIQYKELKE